MIYSNMVVNATVEQQFVQDIVNVTAKRKNNLEAFENERLLNEPKISVGTVFKNKISSFTSAYAKKAVRNTLEKNDKLE